MKKKYIAISLSRVLITLGVIATVPWYSAVAQESSRSHSATTIEEIIVTARRRAESLQDVPIVVNTITSEQLDELQIRQFVDIQTIVPGLNLTPDNVSPNMSFRGVRFDTAASGTNPTVEFYLNDAPIQPVGVMHAMYDVGQIEVLRGPQGTLRGRASPSGSITLTTKRPDLESFGVFVNGSATDIGGRNISGAVNIPVVENILGIRISGLYDENERTRVKSVNDDRSPFNETRGARASLLLSPVESLSLSVVHEKLKSKGRFYPQVESANIADASLPPGFVHIKPGDRRAVINHGIDDDREFDLTNVQLEWQVAGQRINYTGARHVADGFSDRAFDAGDYFGPEFPSRFKIPGQVTTVDIKQQSHEIRLSSDERILDRFGYVVGAFRNKTKTDPSIVRPTLVVLGPVAPTTNTTVVLTNIDRVGESLETSFFGNVTWHLTPATELSAGVRRIDYEQEAGLIVNGVRNPLADEDSDFTHTIYMASLTHRLSDNLMVYGTTGTSWRPGLDVVGDFSLSKTDLQSSFQLLPPEKSTGYEIGFKSDWLDNRLRVNAAIFYQDFKNYPYRGAEPVFYVEVANNPAPPPATIERVSAFNFVGPVPVEVRGLEIDFSYRPTARWSLAGVFAYAEGKIQNGLIPCNDYFPADGAPDSPAQRPSVAQIRQATGGDNLSACRASYLSHDTPKWSSTFQTEYIALEGAGFDIYVRGLLSTYGSSKGDPVNNLDGFSSYSILNLYTGIRDQSGAWEVSAYAKNVLDTEKVLTRNSRPYDVSFNVVGVGAMSPVSNYRGISLTPPRELGINFRYNIAW